MSLSQCPEKYIIAMYGKANRMPCIGLIWLTHKILVHNSGKQSPMQLSSDAVVVEEHVPAICKNRVTSLKGEQIQNESTDAWKNWKSTQSLESEENKKT